MDQKQWFERVTVEVSESGAHLQRIQLTQGAAVWHVWERPANGWPEADEWFEEFSLIVNELAEQWPARQLQTLLVGETRNGTVISQCPFQVRGRDKSATSLTLNEGGSGKLIAETVEMLQRSWEKTLNVQNAQQEIQAKQIQRYGEQVLELLNYVRQGEEYRATEAQRRLEEQQATANQEDPLMDEVKKVLPGLLELGQLWAAQKMKESAAAAAGTSAAGRAVSAAVSAGVDAVTGN